LSRVSVPVDLSASFLISPNDSRWDLVQRVATSRFSKATQLRDIFFYICRRALADPNATIKEYEIGCNVLGRKEDFNPNDDNIVRVQFTHLRKKLEEYFSSEGKDEPIQIVVPKGSYLPRFEAKSSTVHVPETAATAPLVNQPSPAGRRGLSKWVWTAWVWAALSLVAILAIGGAYVATRQSAINNPPQPARDPFWSRLFGNSQPVGVVVADTCLVMLQDVLHTDVLLADYSNRQYPENILRRETDPKLRSALQLIAARQYTSFADTNIAFRLRALTQQFANSRVSVRYARDLSIRDFKTGSFVLIGSRRAIPWVQLFEPQLNFIYQEDKLKHQFYFRNVNPKPGEPAAYIPSEKDGIQETFADVAFLPNLQNNGSILILSGITMAASEAAGELVLRGNFAAELTRMLGKDGVRDKYFEILLKSDTVAGTVRDFQIVTYRIVKPEATGN
jgi:hypothetical protein